MDYVAQHTEGRRGVYLDPVTFVSRPPGGTKPVVGNALYRRRASLRVLRFEHRLFCYALDGTLLWKRTRPPHPIYLDFGTGTSPVAHAGRVYLLQDSERESYLTALDAGTGADVWRVPRPERSTFNRTSSWSTPLVWKSSLRTEIVTTGHGFIQSYDLDGKELWRVARVGMPLASPVAAGDLLIVGTGAQEGDAARPVFAINPGARGDLRLTDAVTSNEHVLWSHPRASGYTPSPLVHQGRVYLVQYTGTMLVLAAETGKEIYRARLGGVGHTFSASPVATASRLYFSDRVALATLQRRIHLSPNNPLSSSAETCRPYCPS
jgi:outer membrane protein assembly factor BamB